MLAIFGPLKAKVLAGLAIAAAVGAVLLKVFSAGRAVEKADHMKTTADSLRRQRDALVYAARTRRDAARRLRDGRF